MLETSKNIRRFREIYYLRGKTTYNGISADGITKKMEMILCVSPGIFNNAGSFFHLCMFSNSCFPFTVGIPKEKY